MENDEVREEDVVMENDVVMEHLQLNVAGGVARLTMNRPDVHNAFNGRLIAEFLETFTQLEADPAVVAVVLGGAGRSFCAGADLAWMKSMAGYDEEANRHGSLGLAQMYARLDAFAKPLVARVQGPAIGGGCGLVAVCDIVVAAPRARFALSEVRLGMAPAVISPFVVRKIGSSKARELFLTGDRIGPQEAKACGLVHRLVDTEEALDAAVDKVLESLLQGGPRALAACKLLAREADTWSEPLERTASLIAALRVGEEGQEGMRAFLEKRKPGWRP